MKHLSHVLMFFTKCNLIGSHGISWYVRQGVDESKRIGRSSSGDVISRKCFIVEENVYTAYSNEEDKDDGWKYKIKKKLK